MEILDTKKSLQAVKELLPEMDGLCCPKYGGLPPSDSEALLSYMYGTFKHLSLQEHVNI